MKKIYINSEDFDTNVAITDDDRLFQFFIEENVYAKTGNIYKAKIEKVVSNMNFVFIDIGDEKPAFLSEKEYFDVTGSFFGMILNGDAESLEMKPMDSIAGIFEKGQEIMVQVIKEPYNTKGARLTTNIMLPGHNVVFCPFSKHTGISKKINSEKERARLKSAVERTIKKLKKDFGVIVRTQAERVPDKEIEKEIKQFSVQWEKIKKKYKKAKSPSLLHADFDLPVKVLRENVDESVGEIITDSKEVVSVVEKYLKANFKGRVKVKHYEGTAPLFEYYELEQQVGGLYGNIVPFKKGGYIKIDVTEALTVFDINSGKFKGVDDVESSLLLMNQNAAKEIARQIILRNIGGLIVIDFIDMQKEENRQKIKDIMETELSKSKMYFKVLKISEFGLMEITRKRDVKRIDDIYFKECGNCGGRGRILTEENNCIKHLKKIKYICKKELEKNVVVIVPEDIHKRLKKDYEKYIKKYEKQYKKKIYLKVGE